MLSPVRGLRPSRAPRSATWNFPNPVKFTSSPLLSESSMVLMTALTALSASFFDRPLVDATLSTNSDFVMAPPLPSRGSVSRAGSWNPAKLTVAPDAGRGSCLRSPQIAAFRGRRSDAGRALRRRNQALRGLQEATRGGILRREGPQLPPLRAHHHARLATRPPAGERRAHRADGPARPAAAHAAAPPPPARTARPIPRAEAPGARRAAAHAAALLAPARSPRTIRRS